MSSPYGSVTGAALDVIIVVPCRHGHPSKGKVTSPKGDGSSGVIASSDFYVTFPSSVQANVNGSASSAARLQRWTSSFLYNNTSSRVGKTDEPMKKVKSDHSVNYSTHEDDRNKSSSMPPQMEGPKRGNIQIQINGRPTPGLEMNFRANRNGEPVCKFVDGNGHRPPTQALEVLVDEAILNYGRNLIRYILFNEQKERIATAEAFLYLWSARDSVIVCDIDGTITKSDVRGVLDTVVQDNFKHVHNGVCKFFNELVDSFELNRQKREGNRGGQVRLFYLTSRPLSYISQTRKLLVGLSQEYADTSFGLPPGPIMCHRGSLSTVLHSELVSKNVYEFKADVLARQIVLPFVAAIGNCKQKLGASESFDNQSDMIWRSESDLSELTLNAADDRLFLAGFGNKVTDAKAYELAGVDRRDIYIINKESRIQCLEYDGTKSSSTDLNLSTNSELPNLCCGFESVNASNNEDRQGSNQTDGLDAQSREISREQVVVDFSPTVLEPSSIESLSRSKRKKKSARQTIRAFSLKKSFASFRSQDSSEETFYGYDDPNLFIAVSERMKRTTD